MKKPTKPRVYRYRNMWRMDIPGRAELYSNDLRHWKNQFGHPLTRPFED